MWIGGGREAGERGARAPRNVAGYEEASSSKTRDEKPARTASALGSGLTLGNQSALCSSAVATTLSSTARTHESCAPLTSSLIEGELWNLDPSSTPKGARHGASTLDSWTTGRSPLSFM